MITSIGGKLETNGACASLFGDIAPSINGDMAFPFGTLGQLGDRALGASHFLRDVSAGVETVINQADENLHWRKRCPFRNNGTVWPRLKMPEKRRRFFVGRVPVLVECRDKACALA